MEGHRAHGGSPQFPPTRENPALSLASTVGQNKSKASGGAELPVTINDLMSIQGTL